MFRSRSASLVHFFIGVGLPYFAILSMYINAWILYLNYRLSIGSVSIDVIRIMIKSYNYSLYSVLLYFAPVWLIYMAANWRAYLSILADATDRERWKKDPALRETILGMSIFYWDELVKECESLPAK